MFIIYNNFKYLTNNISQNNDNSRVRKNENNLKILTTNLHKRNKIKFSIKSKKLHNSYLNDYFLNFQIRQLMKLKIKI